jgi:phosphogluconate dehydratase
MGAGLAAYTQEPVLKDAVVSYRPGARISGNDKILRPAASPFQATGGLRQLSGNLGQGIMKISAVAPERHIVQAPARVFHTQEDVKSAFKADDFTQNTIIVVRFQGPVSNGMPELHALTPILAVLQDRGLKVALVTDGRMSGASGKVPSVIHISPEAALGGPLSRVRDGDIIRLDATDGSLENLTTEFETRVPTIADLSGNGTGVGRELFDVFRRNVGLATTGASVVV